VATDDAGRTDLFVSRVAGGGGRVRLTNDETRETHPRFSPDGERIVFARRFSGTAAGRMASDSIGLAYNIRELLGVLSDIRRQRPDD